MSEKRQEVPKGYMEKKLKLLYIQTGLNILWAVFALAFLAWMWVHPEIVTQILGR